MRAQYWSDSPKTTWASSTVARQLGDRKSDADVVAFRIMAIVRFQSLDSREQDSALGFQHVLITGMTCHFIKTSCF